MLRSARTLVAGHCGFEHQCPGASGRDYFLELPMVFMTDFSSGE